MPWSRARLRSGGHQDGWIDTPTSPSTPTTWSAKERNWRISYHGNPKDEGSTLTRSAGHLTCNLKLSLRVYQKQYTKAVAQVFNSQFFFSVDPAFRAAASFALTCLV